MWDYSKTQKNNEDTNLWYHTSLLSGKPQIQKPLEYNIDQNDFFRIEGHQGQDYRDVLEKIEDLKRENGLAFQVKALSLSLNKQDIDFDDYECEFQDLKVMLDAWQKEQDCILAEISNFFSSFSTKEPGVNVKEKELGISKLRESHLETDIGFSRTPGTAPGGDKVVESVLKESIQPEYTGKATYFISSPVSDNLNTSKDTLGEALVNAYQET